MNDFLSLEFEVEGEEETFYPWYLRLKGRRKGGREGDDRRDGERKGACVGQ